MRRYSLYISLAVFSAPSFSAGFQLNAQSASGLGRAFAGDAIIADDASIVAKNSAGMSLIEKPTFSVGGILIDSQVDISDASYTPISGSTQSIDDFSLDSSTFVPNVHFVLPMEDSPWTFGATVHSNFGTDVRFPSDFAATEFGGTTALTSVNFGVSAAYQLTPQWSVGFGLDAVYGEGEIYRAGLLTIDSDGVEIGFNTGLAYVVNEDHRFGLSYRYSPEMKTEGDMAMTGVPASSLNVPLPDIVEFSGHHQLTTELAFHYSLQWVNWSEFDALTSNEYSTPVKEYRWKDAGHLSLGATYVLSPEWTVRGGYMYDASPVDTLTSLSIPDTNRHWYSMGASYQVASAHRIDVGVSYILGQETSVNESLTTVASSHMESVVGATAWLVGVQYNHTF